MTEDQAFDLARQARWLHVVIDQAQRDYAALVRTKVVKPVGGINEFDNLPIFLDLAEDISGGVVALCEQLLSEFD